MNHKLHLLRTILFVIILYSLFIGDIPAGVFCDEAEIGLRANQLLHGDISFLVTPFFYKHFGYTYGALPVYATAPFVAFFGLNDFSVRLVSLVFAFLSLGTLLFLLYFLKLRSPIIAFLSLALTPLFFHVSRTNFGHLPSLFFLLLGYTLFLLAKKKKKLLFAMFGGISLAIAAYGQISFIIFSILFISMLCFTEIITYKRSWSNYKAISLTFVGFALMLIPLIFVSTNDKSFWTRLSDKDSSYHHFSFPEKLQTMASNYPKYYSYQYLVTGIKPDGRTVVRDFVPGNGILLSITFLLILVACSYYLFDKSKDKHIYLPFFLLLIIYPLPDLITTKTGDPPYGFSLFASTIAIPFIVSYALLSIHNDRRIKTPYKKILYGVIVVVLLIQGLLFYNNYLQLPFTASHSLGWQYGSKAITEYFIVHNNEYDELFISEMFNQPMTLIKFYDLENKCTRCRSGGIKNFDPKKNQIFALRVEELTREERKRMKIKKTIYLPNGYEAIMIGTFR